MGTDTKALGTGRDRTQAEDWQPNRSYVSCVAMEPPDHDSLQSSGLGFQSHEIADTTFIELSAVVDHQHIALFSPFERLQENIDAADMSGGRRATS